MANLDEQQIEFTKQYEAGKQAFERGEYRISIQHLQTATQMVPYASQLGGEVSIWLVTAYQAAGKSEEAIELCKKLCTHPFYDLRQQSKRLLYIIEAPRLRRPQKWMSEIPDLSEVSEGNPEYRRGRGMVKLKKSDIPEFEDLSKINTKDNHFIWIALGIIIILLGYLSLS